MRRVEASTRLFLFHDVSQGGGWHTIGESMPPVFVA